MHPISLLVSVIALASSGAPAWAESEAPIELGEMVVTAAGFEQNISKAPASISVISGEELSKRSYADISDAVKNIPGVYVNGGSNREGAEDSHYVGEDDSAESMPDKDEPQGSARLTLTPDEDNTFAFSYSASKLDYKHSPGVSIDEDSGATLYSQTNWMLGRHMLTFGGQYNYEDLVDETNGLIGTIDSATSEADRWLAADSTSA